MENQVKKCIACENLLTLDHFRRTPLAPDGHANTCKQCALKKRAQSMGEGGRKPEFSAFQARELIEELRARGYVGELTITRKIKV